MSPQEIGLFVVLVPALVAAAVVAASGWVGRRVGIAASGPASVALALGAGEFAAHAGSLPLSFPPLEVTERIPYLVLAATLLGLCESIRPAPGWARWENRLLLTLLTLGLILGPVLGPDWPDRTSMARQGGLVLIVLVVWASLDALAARRSTAVLGPALLIAAACASASLVLSGSLVLGKLGGGLTAALGAVWVVSWW